MQVKIRYKTDAKNDDTLHWRVIIDGIEHSASNVIIHCMSHTTKDIIESGIEKWHISCNATEVKWVGEECIVI
jgi:hypothetical protein